MVIQKNTPNLLELLESYARGATPEVLINLRPPTPIPSRASPTELSEKKRKRERMLGRKVSKKGEIQTQVAQETGKGSKSTRTQQKESATKGTNFEVIVDR